ncbi:DNA (cytosine-5-)-methyltransferase [Desulfobacterota bacterium M19]
MPQVHIKLDENLYNKLKTKATKLNYSIQEISERALQNYLSEPLFSYADEQQTAETKKFRFIDLFAGIGGFRLAFEAVKGECVFSSEWDKFSQKTYYDNFNSVPAGDITLIDPSSIPDHDVLCAGFPCQPFSIAGVSKKNSLGRDHGFLDKAQGTLFFNIAKVIEIKRPKMFILENVKNLKSHDKGNTFKIICSVLQELGYSIFYQIIDAKSYVPQHRERIFIVGFDQKKFDNNIKFKFPEPPDHQPKLSDILEKKVDEKYILSDKLWSYLQAYAAKHKKKGNGFGFGLVEGNMTSRTLSARYYKDGSEILIKMKDSNPRRLTPRECARLMGYPEDFKITVSNTQAYKQFGNSVAVPVVKAVAEKMVKFL